jgi:hypothetical protein
VNVTDGEVYDTQVFTVTVININDPPSIISLPVTTATEEVLYTYDVDASDDDLLNPSGEILTFSLDVFPVGMNINGTTGLIQWTPLNDQYGDNTVIVNVTDSVGAYDLQVFVVNVQNINDPIHINTSPPLTAIEEVLYTYDVNASDDDLNISAGELLVFSLDIKPLGMEIDPLSGFIEWTPTNDQAAWDHTVRINVTDGEVYDTQEFTIFVVNINDQPLIISIPPLTATEEVLFIYYTDAQDDDLNNPSGEVLDFSLDTAPSGMIINTTTGLIQWLPTNDQYGDNIVTVNVSDNSGAYDTQTFVVNVTNTNDPPQIYSVPFLTAIENELYSYDVEVWDDDLNISAGEQLFFSLDVAPVGMTINSLIGLIQWTPTNDQASQDHIVRVNVTDGEMYDIQEFILSVINVNDPPVITTTPITTGETLVYYEYNANATDIDPRLDTLTWNLVTSAIFLNIHSGTGLVYGTPGANESGIYYVNVSVNDGNGGIDSQNYTFTVSILNEPPTIEYIPPVQVQEGVPQTIDLSLFLNDPDTPFALLTIQTLNPYVTVFDKTLTLLYPIGVINDTIFFSVSDGETQTTGSLDVYIIPFKIESHRLSNIQAISAIDGDGSISISLISNPSGNPSDGTIGTYGEIYFDGTGILLWTNITFYYSDNDLLQGMNEQDLRLYLWNNDNQA